MKKYNIAALVCLGFIACNNRDSRQEQDASVTDSSNLVSAYPAATDSNSNNNGIRATDSATSTFLMKAADGGLAEVSAGQMAQGKAVNESVKMFAAMMVNDHTGANAQVKQLAGQRQVMLPAEPSEEHKKAAATTAQKTGAAFDRAYMDMMVKDHKKTISLFQKAAGESGDAEVKTFIEQTLPKLQLHLDSAQAIHKRL